jgi:hypothetical protein
MKLRMICAKGSLDQRKRDIRGKYYTTKSEATLKSDNRGESRKRQK